MKTRRDFLKPTALGVGALSLTPCLKAFAGATPDNGLPKRFIDLDMARLKLDQAGAIKQLLG
jgi:hypothetical protein